MLLTGIAVLLILGVLGTALATRLRVSNILILLLVGMAIANSPLGALPAFQFPATFLVGLAVLTLAMIVFDGTSRFSLHTIDVHTNKAVEMVLVYTAINVLLVGSATLVFFLDYTLQGMLLALIFSVIMAGTDPGSVFILLGKVKHKVFDFLRVEAVFNTPVVVILPFLLLDIMRDFATTSVAATFTTFITSFLMQIVVGIGGGMLMGIIVFRVMRKYYSETLSPVAIIAAAILTYMIAESLQGNGVLAVATLGVMFGNTYVKHRGELMEFSSILALSLEILVFMLVGLLVVFDFSLIFFVKSIVLFGIAVLARYVAVLITLHGSDYAPREKAFMALNLPKGIAVAVVTLTLFVLDTSFQSLVTLMILFLLYSLILSSGADRFGKYYIGKEIVKPK